MSHVIVKAASAGLLLVFAAGAAHAAKPLTVKHHMKAAQKGQYLSPPRTMAEAAQTEIRLPDGKTIAVQVPTELWNYLAVQTDAQGNQRLVESSTDATPAPAKEGSANE